MVSYLHLLPATKIISMFPNHRTLPRTLTKLSNCIQITSHYIQISLQVILTVSIAVTLKQTLVPQYPLFLCVMGLDTTQPELVQFQVRGTNLKQIKQKQILLTPVISHPRSSALHLGSRTSVSSIRTVSPSLRSPLSCLHHVADYSQARQRQLGLHPPSACQLRESSQEPLKGV